MSPAVARRVICRAWRREAEALQIRRGDDILHKFRDAQAGEQFDECLDVLAVGGKFFAGHGPVVRAALLQRERIFAAHLDFRDRRGEVEQVRIAEIIHRAAPRRQRFLGGGAPRSSSLRAARK